MKSGIYEIKNKINSKMYIGRSIDIPKRWKTHKATLKNGSHVNKDLQEDYDKYGLDAFEFRILKLSESDLERWESIYCYESDIWSNGYNKAKMLDYRKITYEDALKLGNDIVSRIIDKNPDITCQNKFNIPIKIISQKMNIDLDILLIALRYVDCEHGDWAVSIHNEGFKDNYILNFMKIKYIEDSMKDIYFF